MTVLILANYCSHDADAQRCMGTEKSTTATALDNNDYLRTIVVDL